MGDFPGGVEPPVCEAVWPANCSAHPTDCLTGALLLGVLAVGELDDQTLGRRPQLGDRRQRGIVDGKCRGGEDVDTTKDGSSVSQQRHRPFDVESGSTRVEPGHDTTLAGPRVRRLPPHTNARRTREANRLRYRPTRRLRGRPTGRTVAP